jgi:hypothetical protein
VPALRALRRAHPLHHVVLAAPSELRPLVELAEVCDEVLPTTGLQPLDWPEPPPTLAVNLHGRGPQSHLLLKSLSPRSLVAFGCTEAEVVGPVWRPDEHEVRRWCRLLEEGLEISTLAGDLRIRPPEASEGTVPDGVVIHPGAASGSRRWPPDRYATVARWVADQGCQVVLTGGSDERELAGTVAARAGLPHASVRAGATDLAALADHVARARLVICGDTGVAHLASAFGVPSVLLFGPTSPERWGPPPTGPHTVLWHGDGTGDPRGDDVDPALAAIEPEEVIRATERHLVRAHTVAR